MTYRGLLVVIPTRNRFPLARRAIESVLSQGISGVMILVSDNSTDQQQRHDLAAYCAGLPADLVRYVSPPSPLPMAAHFDWAMSNAAMESASHVAYLQDRTVFKRGAITALLDVVSAFPEDVVSFNRDYLDDSRRPVRLLLSDWTGRIFRIKSSHLLQLSARAYHPPQLPDVLNAAVPFDVVQEIRKVFGNVFDSISPDFCFAYRCLAIRDSVIYYDRPVYLAYAPDRSNGISYARGQASSDSLDFAANLGALRNFAAPVPALHGITNAVVHEYCFVREEFTGSALPPVNMPAYLGEIDFELRHLVDKKLIIDNRRMLRELGWSSRQRAQFFIRKCTEMLLADPLWVLERLTLRQLTQANWSTRFWRWFDRHPITWTPGGLRLFNSAEEGLAFGIEHLRTRARHLGSMRRRRITRDAAVEIHVRPANRADAIKGTPTTTAPAEAGELSQFKGIDLP